MRLLSLPQPWASLVARGIARFAPLDAADAWRGTVVLCAGPDPDEDAVARLADDPEFAARMAAVGLPDAAAIRSLPRLAVVGAAVVADLWSFGAMEEVASEEDAQLLGDVAESSVFWEFVEPVHFGDPIAVRGVVLEPASDRMPSTARDGLDATPSGLPAVPDPLLSEVTAAIRAAGVRIDAAGLVFWPVRPSPSLMALVGDDALGDREITRRVWAYVSDQDLQDPEDASYVFLDDRLRDALRVDADGVSSWEFAEAIRAQLHPPDGAPS